MTSELERKFVAFSQHFTDGAIGFIRIGGILYCAIPLASRTQVYLGAMVIYRRYGNIIKDVGTVDAVEWKANEEEYTINSVPIEESKHTGWCCKHMSLADISHILTTVTPTEELGNEEEYCC